MPPTRSNHELKKRWAMLIEAQSRLLNILKSSNRGRAGLTGISSECNENWAEAAVDGGLTATPIGEGLDTWWATALKESIPRSFIVWIILIQASTLAAGAGLLLSAAWRDRSRSAAGARDVAEPAVDKTAQLH